MRNKLWLAVGIVSWGLVGWMWIDILRHPSVEKLERSNGQIYHPTYGDYTYGDYPETIPFEQGMTLMPGQSTVGTIMIEIPVEQLIEL